MNWNLGTTVASTTRTHFEIIRKRRCTKFEACTPAEKFVIEVRPVGRSSITNFEAGVQPRISYTSESLIESLFGELLRMELISKLVESIHGAQNK